VGIIVVGAPCTQFFLFFIYHSSKGVFSFGDHGTSSHASSFVGNSFSTLGSINSSDDEGDIGDVCKHGYTKIMCFCNCNCCYQLI